MSISYFRNDELPPWEPTVELNGTSPDLNAGYTFTVKVAKKDDLGTILLTKTTAIFGGSEGAATVNWLAGELDLSPETYEVQLVTKRSSDDFEWTIAETMFIKARL